MKVYPIFKNSMLGNIWFKSVYAAEKLEISEKDLLTMRENGFLKPGIHWRSCPLGQKKPWNPEVLYNVNICQKIINNYSLDNYSEKYVA